MSARAPSTVGDIGIVECPAPRRLVVFYSHAPEDEHLRAELDAHLRLLQRADRAIFSHAGLITAGNEAIREAGKRLNDADIILVLVSASYLNSDVCYDGELKRAMELHHANNARVIPIILRHCDWTLASFARLAPLPRDGKPVTSWDDRDEAWTEVAKGIRSALDELRKETPFED